jgi:hypothetical protein
MYYGSPEIAMAVDEHYRHKSYILRGANNKIRHMIVADFVIVHGSA